MRLLYLPARQIPSVTRSYRVDQINTNALIDRFELQVICLSLEPDRGNPVMDPHLYLRLYK
jgi:hypothetical protein